MDTQQMRELLSKLRNYEIRIRKAINAQMQGDYHSIFKGSGLEFDDVRSYQYGDDVRHIDWNVSAKGHGTFIKTFREEKEQNIFFILDVSGSQEIGKEQRQKIDVSREICGVLALSAIKETSSVGLLCFSDDKEVYIKPHKGSRHVYSLISSIFRVQPKSPKTNIHKALNLVLSIIKRKSVIVLVSDFIDEDYDRSLKSVARLHDLIVIHISDRREASLPSLGIVPIYDKEARKTLWVNTSSDKFRDGLENFYHENRLKLEEFCNRNNANYMALHTDEDFVPKLIRLFKVRNASKK